MEFFSYRKTDYFDKSSCSLCARSDTLQQRYNIQILATLVDIFHCCNDACL